MDAVVLEHDTTGNADLSARKSLRLFMSSCLPYSATDAIAPNLDRSDHLATKGYLSVCWYSTHIDPESVLLVDRILK